MNDYQTGDLLLVNQWSIRSILNHAVDTDSRWSDVGIFIVDRTDADDKPKHGYTDEALHVATAKRAEFKVSVVMMTPAGVRTVSLDDILRIPSFQAVAHRPLAVPNRRDFQRAMKSYIQTIVNTAEKDPKRIVNNPFPPGLKESLTGQAQRQYKVSSHGTLLDSKGRDLKVSGFVKGNPDSQIKSDFTAADFIGTILAQAELINYDPNIQVSDFQQGGRLDDIYGDETHLFPRKSAEDIRQYIIQQAHREAEHLVLQYLESTPVSSYNRYKSSLSNPTQHEDENPESEDEERLETEYPNQVLSSYNTADARERRGNTTTIALGVESDTIDRKIRQRADEAEKYARPVPSFNGKSRKQ